MIKAAHEISNTLGEGAVSFDEDEIEVHGHSDWSTSNSSGRPVAIVYPKTTEDVSQIAKICNKYNVPMGKCSLQIWALAMELLPLSSKY